MIKSSDKTMRILSAVADGKGEPVTIGNIAKKVDMPSSTVSHIVSTLASDGYLIKVSRKSGYVIGPALHYLTRYGIYEAELVGICRPIMRWIERTTHATAVLSVIKSGRKFIIDYADDEQKLFAEHTRIRMGDVYRTATGRAILAEMERDEVAKLYNSLGVPERDHWKEVTSLDSLYEELAKIKKTRVVVTRPDDAEGEKNAVGYGSPLFRDGECIGAVGIAVRDPSAITDERDAELRAALKKAAREINRRLMYE